MFEVGDKVELINKYDDPTGYCGGCYSDYVGFVKHLDLPTINFKKDDACGNGFYEVIGKGLHLGNNKTVLYVVQSLVSNQIYVMSNEHNEMHHADEKKKRKFLAKQIMRRKV